VQLRSPVVTAIVLGTLHFWPPIESTSLNRSLKNLSQVITFMSSTAVHNLAEICPCEASGQIGEILPNFFIYIPFKATHLQVRQLTTLSCLMAQMTQTHARVCLFWLWLILKPIYGIKLPKKPNFRSVNRHSPAKHVKYWNVHIIKTTASIITKFCRVIETHKYSLRVVKICPKQIQDGGRPPFWKIEKSWYLRKRLTDFDEIWHADASRPSSPH